jgi:two-component system capsular synthesis sensor histidine kinase RcsC
LLLHRGLSFLVRTELTVQFYEQTHDVLNAPDELVRSVRETGVAVGRSPTLDVPFDIVVSAATRAAWGADLGGRLWRLTQAADATLSTRKAFELPYRALLIGLDADYAVILPALDPRTDPKAPRPDAGLAAALRGSIVDALAAQTGRRMLAPGEHVLVGPYTDPLLGVPVVTVLSAQRSGDAPAMLIAMTIPADTVLATVRQLPGAATLFAGVALHRMVVSVPPLGAAAAQRLRAEGERTPPGGTRYTLAGAIFADALMPARATHHERAVARGDHRRGAATRRDRGTRVAAGGRDDADREVLGNAAAAQLA